MLYRIVAVPMTLSDLQGHAPNAGVLNLFKNDFSYSCAVVDKIFDRRCMVPVQ